MKLSEQIKEITKSRIKEEPEIKQLRDQVLNIQTQLKAIIEFEKKYSTNWEIIVKEQDSENLKVWTDLHKKIERLYEEVCESLNADSIDNGVIEQAYIRASRKYMNLAFMGPWRQGKSSAFARLTNLKTNIIPVSGNKNCTGTTINVICDSYVDGDKKYDDVAIVYHYSLTEMCNIINEYCKIIDFDFSIKSKNIEEFKKTCKNESEILTKHTPSADNLAYYATLCDYFEHIDDYADELDGRTERLNINDDKELIKYYQLVSFRQSPENQEKYYKCLATKKAEIYTKYKLLDEFIYQSQILDTPGIGESRIGVNEALRKALREDVDIAIAVNMIRDTNSEENVVNEFHKILKQELQGRNPEDFLFYFFNVNHIDLAGAQKVAKKIKVSFSYKQTVEDKKKDVMKSLSQDVEGASGIILPTEHIKFIDFMTGRELTGYNDTEPIFSDDTRLYNVFHSIMTTMASKISSVDEIFYSKARKRHSEIKERWEQLHNSLLMFPLPLYTNEVKIHAKLKELHDALKQLGRDVNLTKHIKTDIQKFCEEAIGIEIGRVLSYNGAKIKSDTNKEEVINTLLPQMKERLNSRDYNARKEFVVYNEIKTELREKLKEKINDHINEEEAQKTLSEFKGEICEVLRNNGSLEFIDENSETWLDSFISKLTSENEYPYLKETFINFRDYKINAKEKLEATIDNILNFGYHCDDFGNEIYSFEEWENALKAMLYSLYQIEANTKSTIEDTILRNELEGLQVKFDEMINNVLSITDVEGTGELGKNRKDLHHFYEVHSDDVFRGSGEAIKQGIIEKWKIIIK